jgi:hypothetical protein
MILSSPIPAPAPGRGLLSQGLGNSRPEPSLASTWIRKDRPLPLPPVIWIMVVSGAAGYVLRKFGFARVLGDRLESGWRSPCREETTSADSASVIVVTSALGLLLAVQAPVWVFGCRKAIADEAESA